MHIFPNKNEFNRHCQVRHGLGKLSYPTASCAKVGANGFPRLANLLIHLRNVHGAEVKHLENLSCPTGGAIGLG